MVPSGPPTGAGGAQSIVSSLLRTNSGSLGSGQPGSISPHQTFSSLISPRVQFNGGANGTNMTFLGGITNASSLLNHSFGNALPASGGVISTPQMNSQQRGGMGSNSLDMLGSTESDPLSFPSPSGSLHGQHLQNHSGKQMIADHSHSQTQQLDAVQNFQQQVSVPHNQQRQQHRGGLGNVGGVCSVKLEEQTGSSDQSIPGQQLPSIRGIGSVKMEPLQLQSVRSLGPAKMEHQQTDSSLFLQQHQQQHAQQQLLQMSRSAPHAAAAAQMSFLQQQRILQIQQQKQQQQQQQHQLFKTLPQRIQLQQQLQHGVPIRPQMKQTIYEPGMCARRLTQYMYRQQHRPEDNNIDFWRKFVAEFFASNAKKRWCVSLYGSGRQTIGVFPQDVWHCEICRRKPGRGFEATVEVLPRLLQIKYASGTLEELLYVDMPRESHTTSGQILLDYAKAVQESVFEQLRVVRDGQLRIVFNPDLKISSWEFCARRHEELIPRRLIMHQVSQLGAVVQKHQTASQNASSLSIQDLQTTCNSFVASARQLAKALEVPLVNDLGYTKRYVRCLQISEVVNSMKDLIDYSRETGAGPMDSLMKFPKRSSLSPGLHSQQTLQQDTQQNVMQNSSQNEQSSHGTVLINNSPNTPSLASTSGTPMVGLLHQNSMNMRQENQMNSLNGVFGSGNPDQIPSASSSNSIPPSQPNPSSPFSLTPTSNNIIAPSAHISRMNCVSALANFPAIQQQTQPLQSDPTDSNSSVQQILQEMMSSQLNGVSAMTGDIKSIGSVPASLNGGNCLVGNERANTLTNNIGVGGGMGIGPSVGMSGLRAAMTNNAMNINGRVGITHLSRDPSVISQYQQQDMGNRLVRGLGSVNSFDNLQFDWKPSP
ncbi:hypothetical protein M5K25_011197 [Dendrobium thyrsiflorum]|uniref:Transcriptional corepressor SEUSS n=1 Tax=Dendrobium thyrsiflorum TaxID=117978 RepID=A0ABD0V938_DENTH